MDKFDKVGKHYRPLVYILSHFPTFVNRKMQKFVKKSFFDKMGVLGGEMLLKEAKYAMCHKKAQILPLTKQKYRDIIKLRGRDGK